MSSLTVQDIMIKKVVSVFPDTSLLEASRLLGEYRIDGAPVVDHKNALVGVLTEYDLVSKGSAVHLPTLQTIFQNISVVKEDRSRFQKETEEITSLQVRDVMNTDPLTLSDTASLEEVVAAFRDHHRVNPIPVVDSGRKVVGVVSRYDVVKLFALAQ